MIVKTGHLYLLNKSFSFLLFKGDVWNNYYCCLLLEVGQGLSAHLLENPAQCASKPSPLKPTYAVISTRCIAVCGGTPSHPASPRGLASPSLWRSPLPGRATTPLQHEATTQSPPPWTLKRRLQTKTSPNLRLSSQPLHRQTRPHAAARSARGTTALRFVWCPTGSIFSSF